jgi:hypothetical protein
MRENQLLSPNRQIVRRAGNPHEGTIAVEAPNELWGGRDRAAFTEKDGQVGHLCSHRSLCMPIASRVVKILELTETTDADPTAPSGLIEDVTRQFWTL